MQANGMELGQVLESAALAAGAAIPLWNRAGAPLTAAAQGLYRKVLALPIARGWIRA